MRFLFFSVARAGVGLATEWFGYSRRRRYGTGAPGWEGIIVLSPAGAARRKNPGADNSAQSTGPVAISTQQRLLKLPLKVRQGTGRVRKDGLEMLHGLQQGIAVRTG